MGWESASESLPCRALEKLFHYLLELPSGIFVHEHTVELEVLEQSTLNIHPDMHGLFCVEDFQVFPSNLGILHVGT